MSGYRAHSYIIRQVINLHGEKGELDWPHAQAQLKALAASDEIQEGSEPMSFDVLVSGPSEV